LGIGPESQFECNHDAPWRTFFAGSGDVVSGVCGIFVKPGCTIFLGWLGCGGSFFGGMSCQGVGVGDKAGQFAPRVRLRLALGFREGSRSGLCLFLSRSHGGRN